ncbi:MAG: nucleoside triphosphate pyrophosphohydrolase family protein [Arenicellales bacterium]|jgi:NTP pyrophosphatase (non-canonical NTP hydrolase)
MDSESNPISLSFDQMMAAVQAFHDKHDFRDKGGENMVYRLALMTEELGEIAECVTKGKGRTALSEECADLLILLMGNAISENFDLGEAFWRKMKVINSRDAQIVDGRVRVTAYRGADD